MFLISGRLMKKNNNWHPCSWHMRCAHGSFSKWESVAQWFRVLGSEVYGPGASLASPHMAVGPGTACHSAVPRDTDTRLVKSGRGPSAWSSLSECDCLLDVISDWLFLWSWLSFIKTSTLLCPCNTSVPFQICWKVSFIQNYIPQRSSVSGGGSCPQSYGH